MKALICECCGGQIDPNTMKCKYCGTAYERDEQDTVVRIKTIPSPVRIYEAQIDVDNLVVNEIGEDNAAKMAVTQLSRKIADAIVENMEIDCQYDPIYNAHKVRAIVRIVKPDYMF